MLELNRVITAALVSVSAFAATETHAASRDTISIVGSSTVYPFATVVAERFGRSTDFGVPKVESTGSGGGLKLFCAGVGVDTPDITNASRKIKGSEVENCMNNNVKEIVEVKIGYDGIVLANSVKSDVMSLTVGELYQALAKVLPDEKGQLVGNPNKTWKDINANLPNTKIEVLGPPPTSGTRDAFVELVMEEGCLENDSIQKLKKEDKKRFQAACHAIREDGAFIEAGENDNLIVQKLSANPSAFGIFGYSFLDQNSDKVHGAKINGVAPEFEAISSGDYPVSRSLYFYVKKAHIGVVPGLKEYVDLFTSEDAIGAEGYLTDRGLIPLDDTEWTEVRDEGVNLTVNIP